MTCRRGARRLAAWLLGILLVAGFAPTALADGSSAPDDSRPQVLVLLQVPPAHFRADGHYAGGYADIPGRAARRRVAAQLAREHGLTMTSDWPMPLLGLDCYVMDVPATQSAQAVAAALSGDDRVAWAQPTHLYRALGHDDPLFALQPAARDWRLAELHDVSTGRGVRVAVVDSGVEAQHPDLAGQIAQRANFVADGPDAAEAHGTAVAGIIAARADNGAGIAGVAPNASLLALRACRQGGDDATRCTSLSLALALHEAVQRDAQIINLSLSGPPDRLLDGLLDAALARGITLVAAADPAASNGGFPASHRGVVGVAEAGSGSSGHGSVMAPGRDVPTTAPGSRWTIVSGASYAAAHVTGLFALLRALPGPAVPVGGSTAVEALVLRTDGQIDACATLQRRSGACACGCIAAQQGLGAAPLQ